MASQVNYPNAQPAMPSRRATPAPAAAANDSAAIDQAAIASMRLRRPDLLARIFKAYLKHTPAMVAELRNQLDRSDVTGLRFSAHTIKSSSANVGARRLQTLCQSLEALASAPDATISACEPFAMAIVQEFDLVRIALEVETL